MNVCSQTNVVKGMYKQYFMIINNYLLHTIGIVMKTTLEVKGCLYHQIIFLVMVELMVCCTSFEVRINYHNSENKY